MSLEAMYHAIQSNNRDALSRIEFYASDVHYVRAALKARGVEASLKQVRQYLYEEGLLPASEYGIPDWYIRKYGKQHHGEKQA